MVNSMASRIFFPLNLTQTGANLWDRGEERGEREGGGGRKRERGESNMSKGNSLLRSARLKG